MLYLLEEVSLWSSCLRGSCRFSYKEIHMACSAIHIHQGGCSNHRRELEKKEKIIMGIVLYIFTLILGRHGTLTCGNFIEKGLFYFCLTLCNPDNLVFPFFLETWIYLRRTICSSTSNFSSYSYLRQILGVLHRTQTPS